MLAMVIIGFGVLSVSALFAGGVAQQRRASDQALSVALSRNADALLSGAVGRLEGPGLVTPNPGRWEPLFIRNANDAKLRVDPTSTNSVYFVVRSRELTLFENPPFFDGTQFYPSDQSKIFPQNDDFGVLPHERIVSTTLTIVFEVTNTSGATRQFTMTVNESEENRLTNDERNQSQGSVTFEKDPTMPGSIPRIDVIFARDGRGEVTRLQGLQLGTELGATEWVSRVFARPYDWRSETVASLNDRMLFVDDPGFPYGRKPAIGYTCLRRAKASSSQLMVMTYSMQAIDKPSPRIDDGEPSFIPPETRSDTINDTGLLREAELTLGYDEDLRQFYVEGDAEEEAERFAIAIGQILIMSYSQNDYAGSDVAVKVISVRNSPGASDRIRGYIDRSPRVDGKSPLRNLDSTERIFVWALQPEVTSLSSDRVDWEITPIDARIFQLEG